MQRKTHDASGSPCFLKPFKVTAASIASSLLPSAHIWPMESIPGCIASRSCIRMWLHWKSHINMTYRFFFFTLEHEFESIIDIYCRKRERLFVQAALDLQRNLWYAGDCGRLLFKKKTKKTPAVQADRLFAFLKHAVIVWKNALVDVEVTNQREPCARQYVKWKWSACVDNDNDLFV